MVSNIFKIIYSKSKQLFLIIKNKIMENKELKENISEEEGFRIINEMINTAKTAVSDNSFHYLLWGWLVFIAAALNYYLFVFVKTEYQWLPWPILMGAGGIIAAIYSNITKKKEKVVSYFGKFMAYTWTAVVIGIILVGFIAARFCITAAYPAVMIIYGIGLHISGRTFKFAPLIIGSIVCWLCGAMACYVSFDYQLILLCISVLIGYIIPGYILKRQYKHETV
jgi:hypothetical protein